MHEGNLNHLRVSIIEVVPDEIRLWYPTKEKVGRAVEIGVSAVTGELAAPGELHTITGDEVRYIFFLVISNHL